MNLVLIFNTIWRHKWLVFLGLLLGVFASVNSLYRVSLSPAQTSVVFTPRSSTVYETSIELIVSEARFSIGRAGLVPGVPDSFQRTISLTPTYSRLITSEAIIKAVEQKVGPLKASISSGTIKDSPIITVTVQGSDPQHIVEVASQVAVAFSDYLKAAQELYGIPSEDRILINKLASPLPPVPLKSRTAQMAILAFLAPIIVIAGVIFILENIRQNSVITQQNLAVDRVTVRDNSITNAQEEKVWTS